MLNAKTALVTGSTSGIGLGIARALAAKGANLVLNGFGDESEIALEWHAGGGIEIGLGPVSVVGDVRYCGVGEVGGDAVEAALGRAYDPSGWYASLSAAISF